MELVEGAVHWEEASLEVPQASLVVQQVLVVLELAEAQDCQEVAMAYLTMKSHRESVVPGGRMLDGREQEGAPLDRRVPESVLDTVVGEALLAEILLAESRPVSVPVVKLVEVLV